MFCSRVQPPEEYLSHRFDKILCAAARQRIKAQVKALVDSADEEEAHATELSALLVGVASLLLFMQAWEFPDSHVRIRPWKKP